MLTEIYIEALLVDEDLADQVWELWDEGVITDGVAAWAWFIVASRTIFQEIGERRAMDYELAIRSLETEGFSWDRFRELFPFGDISLREAKYQTLVINVLEKLEDKQQQELLLDMLDTQLCVYLEQTWIQNEQYEKKGEQGPFIDGHWIAGQLQINSNLRWQYDLKKRDSRAAMLKVPKEEMLLDRIVGGE